MTNTISPEALDGLLKGKTQFALIDVREPGEYNSTHIPGASLIPRKQLEFLMADSVPLKNTPVVVCDDDGRRAALATATLEKMGYSQVSMLEGGINWWVSQDFQTEWGVNVPSKDFGEKVEVVHHVPEIDATELHERIERGDELVILDSRTPEEFRRFCIPGGRSVPGAELALRITDITKDISKDATVIVNCAGRTRSIIGTQILRRMGLENVYGLKNGTAGWVLAGHQLETGADRVELPDTSPEGLEAARAYADKLASEDGVNYINPDELESLIEKGHKETVYLVDVRTHQEYEQGHIPGFRWFPGGQAVQRADEVAVVKNATFVFACDDRARATVTASWYRQMGFENVNVLHGGTTAWQEAGKFLTQGGAASKPIGLDEAKAKVKSIFAQELQSVSPSAILFVDTSQDFANGHVPGSRWVARGWLEIQVADVASDKNASVVVTCTDGQNSVLAGATLLDMGYTDVSVLDGGVKAWHAQGFDVETGLSGVMNAPTDMVLSGIDRNYADMMNYLRWEEALGEKYAE